jgi:hypothetical protein
VACCLGALPPYFQQELARIQWIGPALPAECDPLYARILELERLCSEATVAGAAES